MEAEGSVRVIVIRGAVPLFSAGDDSHTGLRRCMETIGLAATRERFLLQPATRGGPRSDRGTR
jgi:enoyl-CoA hydratase/carnithine racemase